MPGENRQALQSSLFVVQMALGWCFPNAVMQYALPDLEGLSIDIDTLSRKRARMTATLESAGYHVLRPEGTFYLFCKYPGDGQQVWDALADRDVFVLPGSMMDVPDHFRISLTASESMIERSLPIFEEAAQAVSRIRQFAASGMSSSLRSRLA
jgi:aspartate aminotransferase